MSKYKRRPKKHRRPIRPRHRNYDADYWLDELEKGLSRFGATSSDLPELDPESCKTDKQYRHAVRVRARFLVHQIREIEEGWRGEEAERLFGDLMTRAGLIDTGPAWFVIEKQSRDPENRSVITPSDDTAMRICWER